MIDKNKIMNGLLCHAQSQQGYDCNKCGYLGVGNCSEILAEDVLKLLKVWEEKEAKIIKIDEDFGVFKVGKCPNCGSLIDSRSYPMSCGCGQAVKWDENP